MEHTLLDAVVYHVVYFGDILSRVLVCGGCWLVFTSSRGSVADPATRLLPAVEYTLSFVVFLRFMLC